jgi:hypothetical protein
MCVIVYSIANHLSCALALCPHALLYCCAVQVREQRVLDYTTQRARPTPLCLSAHGCSSECHGDLLGALHHRALCLSEATQRLCVCVCLFVCLFVMLCCVMCVMCVMCMCVMCMCYVCYVYVCMCVMCIGVYVC